MLALNQTLGLALGMNPTKHIVISGPMLGLVLYVWPDAPSMWYNASKVIVSRQPSGNGKFAVAPEILMPVA